MKKALILVAAVLCIPVLWYGKEFVYLYRNEGNCARFVDYVENYPSINRLNYIPQSAVADSIVEKAYNQPVKNLSVQQYASVVQISHFGCKLPSRHNLFMMFMNMKRGTAANQAPMDYADPTPLQQNILKLAHDNIEMAK